MSLAITVIDKSLLQLVLMPIVTIAAFVVVFLLARAKNPKPPAPRKPAAPRKSAPALLFDDGNGTPVASRTALDPVPLFLLLGFPNSGKTALLRGLRRAFSATDRIWAPDLDGEVSRWSFPGGEVMEVASDLFAAGASGNGEPNAWKHFLGHLQKQRPQRPLDGIVLTVPCTELAGDHALDTRQLRDRAAQISQSLKLLSDQLGFTLPVYLLVTKCETVLGYGTFVDAQLQSHRDEIFGWSNPYNLDATFSPQWTARAFAEVHRVLVRQRADFLARGTDPKTATQTAGHPALRDGVLKNEPLRDQLFLFPARLQQLQTPLADYLGQILQGSGHLQFRGIYFSGSAAAASRASDEFETDEANTSSFVADLFARKIFPERGLARPLETAFARCNTKVLVTCASCAIAVLLLIPGVWLGWHNLSSSADRTGPCLRQISQALSESKLSQGKNKDADATTASAYAAIYAAQALSSRNFQSVFLPASLISPPRPEVQDIMPAVFNRLVYPGLQAELKRRIDELLYGPEPVSNGETPVEPKTAPVTETRTSRLFSRFAALRSKLEGTIAAVLHLPQKPIVSSPPIAAKNAPQAAPLPANEALQRLSSFTDKLFSLEDNILLFNGLAPVRQGNGQEMLKLADWLSPRTFASLPSRDTSGLDDIVRASVGVPLDGHPWNQPTVAKLEALVTDVLSQRMNAPRLLVDLNDLDKRIAQLRAGELETYEELSGLRLLLATVQTQLAAPELQWIAISDGQFHLPDDLNQALTRIFSRTPQQNVLLCEAKLGDTSCANLHTLQSSIAEMASWHATEFRNQLLSACTEITCALLATTDNKLQFSKDTLTIQSVLNNFLQLSFVAHEGTARPRQPGKSEQLFWDANRLQAAIQDKQAYDTFFAGNLTNVSEKIQDTFEKVAQARLEPNIVEAIALAQQFQDLPLCDPAKQATFNEASSFQLVSKSLGEVLVQFGEMRDQFNETDFDNDDQLLHSVITSHALQVLTRIDHAFDSSYLYWPHNNPAACGVRDPKGVPNFDRWEEGSLPSAADYGKPTADAMAAYLVTQRQDVQQYVDSAQPLATFLQQNDSGDSKQKALIAKWQGIASDLQTYASAPATSGLGSLENFLANTMDKMEPPECQAAPSTVSSAQLYFVRVRRSLENSLNARCLYLSSQTAAQQYKEIADFFNLKLKGKFPFSAPPTDATAAEADPSDLLELFHKFDAYEKSVRLGLQVPSTAYSPTTASKITAFLDQIDGLRPLFASLLSEQPAPVPALDFAPTFRVNRSHELNGNQIIDWTLQTGGDTFRKSDAPKTGHWTFGEPVTLVLRWAKDAPEQQIPIKPASGGPTARTVMFYYRDPWSLFTLLTQHATPAADLTRSVDSDPTTLVFTAGQESSPGAANATPAPPAKTPANSNAKVFIRMKIFAPGKTENLRLPPFPPLAPTL